MPLFGEGTIKLKGGAPVLKSHVQPLGGNTTVHSGTSAAEDRDRADAYVLDIPLKSSERLRRGDDVAGDSVSRKSSRSHKYCVIEPRWSETNHEVVCRDGCQRTPRDGKIKCSYQQC